MLEIRSGGDCRQPDGTTVTGTVAPCRSRSVLLPSNARLRAVSCDVPKITAAASTSSARSAKPCAADVEATGAERVLLRIDGGDDGEVASGSAPGQSERDRVLAGLGSVVPDDNAAGHGTPYRAPGVGVPGASASGSISGRSGASG